MSPSTHSRRLARGAIAAAIAAALAGCATARRIALPVERNAYARPSTSAEMRATLAAIAAAHPGRAAIVPIGGSALGQSLEALLISHDPANLARGAGGAERVVVLLVGSQHGNEPSGGEALLALAAELAGGSHAGLLDGLDLIVVPNANPDGRDRGRRGNGNGVNLSTNFVTLSEPESRAVAGVLRRWRPDVVLDVHESAIFKPSTLGSQGYLTDFEAQLGAANNSNVPPAASALSRTLLAETLAAIAAAGLPANEYIGEITDVDQPITHGGLSARNLRNAAGLDGALSFVLENRLDPKFGSYPTPRNLRGRIAKQRRSIAAFLAVCLRHREAIARSRDARRRPPRAAVRLDTRYVPSPEAPTITLRLRRLDGRAEARRFAYHGAVAETAVLVPPRAYAITAHHDAMRALLERHGFAVRVLDAPLPVRACVQHVAARTRVKPRFGFGHSRYVLRERAVERILPAGTLWVSLDQPRARLLPLLLEPRSTSSIFEEPPYEDWIQPRADLFVLRVER